MPQPVKLSDALIDAARAAAEGADRSLAGQIEHWARLGRSVESALTVSDVTRVKRSLGRLESELPEREVREKLLQSLRLAVSLDDLGNIGAAMDPMNAGPRYGTDPAFPGLLVRVDPDGKRTPGRFVNRRFVPLEALGVAGVGA